MAFCINCGQKLAEGAKFCANCGKAVSSTNSTSQRETVFDGEIHKCPNCGEVLNSFVINCPSCGYELRNVKGNNLVNELAKKIEQASSVEEKIELITNFYVPNTKEDIYDFFILAVSNLEDTVYDTDDAWQAKLEQTYHKAKISFGKTPEFDYIEKLYVKTRSKVAQRVMANFIRKNKKACLVSALLGMGILFIILGISLKANGTDEGAVLGLLGMFFLFSPALLLESQSLVLFKPLNKNKKSTNTNNSDRMQSNVQSVGKEANDFIHEYYQDVVEQLRVLGFQNIITIAEKKGLLDTEGAVKGISIAGNSEFSDDDEFDIHSKIIIRYYSRNC